MQRCALVLLVCIALVAPPRLSMRASSLIAGPSPGTPPLSERDDLSTWQIIYACSWDYQFYNGFEGWAVGDWDEADACYHWDDDTDAAARYYLVHAMHCADCQGDCFSPNCANTPQTYADNMEAYAQRRIDLSGWSTSDTISAKFYLWYDTEQNYDWVRFLVSDRDGAAGSWRELRSWSGQHRQWELVTINLSEYAGQSDIWICFKFDSDGSVHGYEGAYVDELLITGERSTARPDLAVPQIDWTPSAPKVGDSVRFQVHLANQGSSNTSPWGQACVSLFIDGTYLHDECVANVSPGTNEFLDFYWTATAGDHTIRAVADYGNFIPESNESNNERQETLRTACPAPANLSASPSLGTIRLDWQDNCSNEDSFKIYRDGSLVHTVGAGSTSWVDTGLPGGIQRCYYIVAHNAAGDSARSNTACATPSSPCPAPANVTAVALSRSSIKIDWQDNCGDEDSFRIYRDGSQVHTAGSGTTSWTDTGLVRGRRYCYAIVAHNAQGDSAGSNSACATTHTASVFLPFVLRTRSIWGQISFPRASPK